MIFPTVIFLLIIFSCVLFPWYGAPESLSFLLYDRASRTILRISGHYYIKGAATPLGSRPLALSIVLFYYGFHH
jgi:pilus assembly protein TadC